MDRRRMMMGEKRAYIYKPGFEAFENCIEYGTKGTDTPKLSFGENSFNLIMRFPIIYQSYFYIKADFSGYRKLVFKVKNVAEGKNSQIGFKERHLNAYEGYEDMTDGVLVSGAEEQRIIFDISKVTGEQYIFIGGEADASVDVFDIHFE